MFGTRTARIRRARLVPIALTTAALSSAVLGASVTGTLSAFNASITNSTNSAVSGSLVMRESSQGKTDCLSSSGSNNSFTDCAGINKYGGTTTPLIPGRAVPTVVNISNMGSTAVSSFTIRPGTCTKTNVGGSANGGDLCQSLQLTVTCAPVSSTGVVGTAVDVYRDQPLSAIANPTAPVDLGGRSTDCVPASNNTGTDSGSVQFTFSVVLPVSSTNNAVQGQSVSQPIVWTFTGA